MKTKKEVKPFEYEVEDFTPGFVFGVAITVAFALALVVLFGMIIAAGVVQIGGML